MEENHAELFGQVEDAFREVYSALPLAYATFAVKVVLQAKDDNDLFASILAPCVFPDMESATHYRDQLVQSPIAQRLIQRWVNVGSVVLPDTEETCMWRAVSAGVVPLNVGDILSVSDM